MVSHDRDFLNRQIDRVLSLEVEGLRSYAGNYDLYKQLRAEEERAARVRGRSGRRREREESEAFIDRFRCKASKARQVKAGSSSWTSSK